MLVIYSKKTSKIENKTQPSFCLQTWLQQNLRISTNHKYRIYKDVFLQPDISKTWRFVKLTFFKPVVSDVLKPNVLKPDVLKHDVLKHDVPWVHQISLSWISHESDIRPLPMCLQSAVNPLVVVRFGSSLLHKHPKTHRWSKRSVGGPLLPPPGVALQ